MELGPPRARKPLGRVPVGCPRHRNHNINTSHQRHTNIHHTCATLSCGFSHLFAEFSLQSCRYLICGVSSLQRVFLVYSNSAIITQHCRRLVGLEVWLSHLTHHSPRLPATTLHPRWSLAAWLHGSIVSINNTLHC
jgi:hypothetical protein